MPIDVFVCIDLKIYDFYKKIIDGIYKHNHASADLTIKKMMVEKRTVLTDLLVKATAWTHNTSITSLDIHLCNQ